MASQLVARLKSLKGQQEQQALLTGRLSHDRILGRHSGQSVSESFLQVFSVKNFPFLGPH